MYAVNSQYYNMLFFILVLIVATLTTKSTVTTITGKKSPYVLSNHWALRLPCYPPLFLIPDALSLHKKIIGTRSFNLQ